MNSGFGIVADAPGSVLGFGMNCRGASDVPLMN
jgi:hypothetical protein